MSKIPPRKQWNQDVPMLCQLTPSVLISPIPAELELAKSERKELVDKALEHLGSIAYGEEFSTREEAEKWFKNYFEKEANKNRQTQE